jgi:citrate lyase subunit beta / citryl-CoA lyase
MVPQSETRRPIRSALYVPGHRSHVLRRALARGADALIVDLEDAVPVTQKAAARDLVVAWLATLKPACATQVWVRVNPGALRFADVEAIATAPVLAGICVAKTEDAKSLRELDALLTELGSAARLAPVLETAGAVLDAREIAACPRVERLQVGEADLAAELGMRPGPDRAELMWVRTMVVLASAAAGIGAPLGPVATAVRDLDGLRVGSEALRRMGFSGRACVHPSQLPVVHEVFTPSAEEVARAREVVARFDAAGEAVVLDEDGGLLDEAVVRRLRALAAGAP